MGTKRRASKAKGATPLKDKIDKTKRKNQSLGAPAADASQKKVAGDRVRIVEEETEAFNLKAFNHAGPLRRSIRPLISGSEVSKTQFRDKSKKSPELADGAGAGRHEALSTSKRMELAGNAVAVAVGAAARVSTALAPLRGPNNEVIPHTGLFSAGLSTEGQATAHNPFHALPAQIASEQTPEVATAMAIDTALEGLSRARYLRTDTGITKSVPTLNGGALEAPSAGRGNDDGYESDTNRGRFVRRFAVGEIHLKNTLRTIRSQSKAAAARTRSPSPNPRRGGLGSSASKAVQLPDVQSLTPEQAATALANFAFLPLQTLKPQSRRKKK